MMYLSYCLLDRRLSRQRSQPATVTSSLPSGSVTLAPESPGIGESPGASRGETSRDEPGTRVDDVGTVKDSEGDPEDMTLESSSYVRHRQPTVGVTVE